MAEDSEQQQLKPIRWLAGVLHLRAGGKVTIYGPGDVISDPEHLAALGPARIQTLIKEGKAAPADTGAIPTSAPLSAQEKADGERVLQIALNESVATIAAQQVVKKVARAEALA